MPYRGDHDPSAAKAEAVAQELAATRARLQLHAGETADLKAVEARLAAELVDARLAALEAHPSTLAIDVASPCYARWDAMTGHERVRFCGGCRKNVYNLSAMTSEEVVTLVRDLEGRMCIRYFRRADGTLITSDCGPEVTHRRVRRAIGAACAVAVTAGLGLIYGRGPSPLAAETLEDLQARDHVVGPASAGLMARAIPVPAFFDEPPERLVPYEVLGDASFGSGDYGTGEIPPPAAPARAPSRR